MAEPTRAPGYEARGSGASKPLAIPLSAHYLAINDALKAPGQSHS
jgi:hypothetical protein